MFFLLDDYTGESENSSLPTKEKVTSDIFSSNTCLKFFDFEIRVFMSDFVVYNSIKLVAILHPNTYGL